MPSGRMASATKSHPSASPRSAVDPRDHEGTLSASSALSHGSLWDGDLKSISQHEMKPWLKPLFAGICKGIIKNRGFLGGAKWISQPSTV